MLSPPPEFLLRTPRLPAAARSRRRSYRASNETDRQQEHPNRSNETDRQQENPNRSNETDQQQERAAMTDSTGSTTGGAKPRQPSDASAAGHRLWALDILIQALALVAIIGLGQYIKYLRWVGPEHFTIFSKLAPNLTLPCAVAVSMNKATISVAPRHHRRLHRDQHGPADRRLADRTPPQPQGGGVRRRQRRLLQHGRVRQSRTSRASRALPRWSTRRCSTSATRSARSASAARGRCRWRVPTFAPPSCCSSAGCSAR